MLVTVTVTVMVMVMVTAGAISLKSEVEVGVIVVRLRAVIWSRMQAWALSSKRASKPLIGIRSIAIKKGDFQAALFCLLEHLLLHSPCRHIYQITSIAQQNAAHQRQFLQHHCTFGRVIRNREVLQQLSHGANAIRRCIVQDVYGSLGIDQK